MTPIIVETPLPSVTLSPNARSHWTERHKATRQANHDGYYQALEAVNRWAKAHPAKDRPKLPAEAAVVHITWTLGPRAQVPDRDNALASCKGVLDSLQRARLFVNDRDILVLPIAYAHGGKPGLRILVKPCTLADLEALAGGISRLFDTL